MFFGFLPLHQVCNDATSLGVGPRKNCEYALDDQTQQELE